MSNSWVNHVSSEIEKYPSLFACSTWDDSEFNVAHQAFITLGNGMEWIEDENGYLILSSLDYKFHDSEHSFDKFINNEWWECWNKDENFPCGESWITFKEPKGFNGKILHQNSKHRRRDSPYPNFKKTYSKVWSVDVNMIETSWRNAIIKHYEYWLKYFKGENPEIHVGKSKDYLERWSNLPVDEVVERWSIPIWDGDNLEESVQFLRNKYLEETLKYINDSLNRLNNTNPAKSRGLAESQLRGEE